MNVRRMFDELRFDRNHHMGLGDIRLTIAQQDEVVAEAERLAARLAEAERFIEELRDESAEDWRTRKYVVVQMTEETWDKLKAWGTPDSAPVPHCEDHRSFEGDCLECQDLLIAASQPNGVQRKTQKGWMDDYERGCVDGWNDALEAVTADKSEVVTCKHGEVGSCFLCDEEDRESGNATDSN